MTADLIDTVEMYLRTILELEEEGQVPMRARIAERLEQSGPTVSQTCARMERLGLLIVSDDRHLELTPAGRTEAVAVMRKHRLAERLLADVIGLDSGFGVAFAKSQLGGGTSVPKQGNVFVSVRDSHKSRIVPTMKLLAELGFKIVATSGTQRFLEEHGVEASKINKVLEGRPHVVDAIKNGEIQLLFNTTEGKQAVRESHSIRREAVARKVTYYTTVAAAHATCEALDHLEDLDVNRLQDLHGELGVA